VQQAWAAAQPVPVAVLPSFLAVPASLVCVVTLVQAAGCAPQPEAVAHVSRVVPQVAQSTLTAASQARMQVSPVASHGQAMVQEMKLWHVPPNVPLV
jgi:hypothetical protein